MQLKQFYYIATKVSSRKSDTTFDDLHDCLSFSSGVPVYPANIHWVVQWYRSIHWVNQWHSSGIPVHNGPVSAQCKVVRLTTNKSSALHILHITD